MRRALVLAAMLAFLCLPYGALPADASPGVDLKVTLIANTSGPAAFLGAPVSFTVRVENLGDDESASFIVHVSCTDPSWKPDAMSFGALSGGQTAEQPVALTYNASRAGDWSFYAVADPAGALNETSLANNQANVSISFRQRVIPTFVDVEARRAAKADLPEGSALVFRLILADGEAILFEADAAQGDPSFDQYLMDEEGWQNYTAAADGDDRDVYFFQEYSSPADGTTHVSFTTAPLPAGHYYIVLENADHLQHGAQGSGSIRIDYAVARVSNSLPVLSLVLIVGAASAAIVATVRWRRAFDVTSPLLDSESMFDEPVAEGPGTALLDPRDEPAAESGEPGSEKVEPARTKKPPRPPRK